MKKILNFSTRIAVALMVALSQLFFIPLTASAVGEPEIVGGTTINGLVDVYVPITGLTVTGTTTDPVPVTLSVPQGQLSMTTTTGLTFSGSQTGASLSFTGSQANVNAALATLRYRTTRAETVQMTATMSSPGVVYFPGNGHIYEVIDHGSPLSWNDAKVAAEGLTKNGATGYLATITSQAENDYLLGKLIGDGWFGASDATTEDDWQWVTGPEAGTSFWQGLGDGSPVGGFFSNWSGGEPNNAGDEDCAQFYSNGSGWNDLPCGSPALNYYVVEYGTDGQLPVAPSNTVYTVTTTFPPAQEIPVASCLDLIDVADNSIDHRYDNLSLTSNIDCAGETIAPMFSDVDPDLGIFGFRGTFDGNGHTISNITIDENANNTGLIATTDGATIQDLSVNGSVKGGDTCVGGLVGLALNTTFNDVSVDVDVTSYNSNSYGLGGMIGCLQSHAGTSAVTDSSSTGSVTGYSSMGGMIGSIDAENGGTATITGNTATTPPASTNGYNVGGLVGEVDADDDNTTITFSDNTTGGLNLPDVYTVGGVVGNLSADNDATINLTQNTVTGDVTGGGSVGGLLGGGYAEDNGQLTISNFHYAHDITAGDSYAGGIIGEAGTEGNSNNTKLIITNSSVSGSVSGGSEVGGILGSVYWDYGVEESRISYSHVSGNVTSDSDEAGGLAGSASGLIVEHSYNTGNVEASGSAGGLIGEASDTSISESYVTGSVVSTGDGVGGLVGKNGSDAQITESYATGAVQGFSRVGGLVGANGSGALIRDSYARGAVTGNNNTGGLAGRCGDGMIENSYATGAVTGSVTTGGLLAYNAGSCVVSNSFWDTQTTTQATSAGNATGKTTAQMKTKTMFTDTATAGLTQGWDFASVWGMNTSVNNGYACLLWQANSCGDSEDSDGVSNAIENAAPNTGDANNDSVADSQQSNVASFLNGVTQNYTVLELNAACDLTSVSSQAESNNATDDAGFVYPNGFVHFTADCGTPGYTTNVTQYYYGSVASNVEVRKYNPATQTYTKINTATVDRVTIAGQQVTRVVYQITDGGTLDEDGTANGIIVDPVGLGVVLAATTPVANNGLSGTGQNVTVGFLTAGMLMLGGAAVITYRRFRLDRR